MVWFWGMKVRAGEGGVIYELSTVVLILPRHAT